MNKRKLLYMAVEGITLGIELLKRRRERKKLERTYKEGGSTATLQVHINEDGIITGITGVSEEIPTMVVDGKLYINSKLIAGAKDNDEL